MVELHPSISFGSFPIYNILGGIGFLFALILLIHNLNETNLSNAEKDKLLQILSFCFIFGLFSANFINWFLFPQYLKLNIMLRLRYAGFSFYFGLIGFIFISALLLKLFRYKVVYIFNILVPSLLIFHAFGRIGCSFAGCCYGKIINMNFFNLLTLYRFPAREIESLILFILFFIVQFKVKENRIYFYAFTYPVVRFLLEFGRGDNRGVFINKIFSPAQWISIFIILTASVLIIRKKCLRT